MKYLIPVLIFITLSCESSTKITEGQWSGWISPMNHPEMNNPLVYDVRYQNNALLIDIIGENSEVVQTRNVQLTADTLFFSFNEPEQQVLLNCALAKNSASEFSGRCTGENGKWALFTMSAPE